MGKTVDLTEQRFGKLVAKFNTGEKHSGGTFIWRCVCDCGAEVDLPSRTLLHDKRKHCGCSGRKIHNHGYYKTPTYRSWQEMCARVRSNVKYYEDVEICDRWDVSKGGGFENFIQDMGERPEGTTLNRVNGAKLYSSETCEWANLSVQSFDQRRRVDNKSGKTGVHKVGDKWEARITKDHKTYILGTFESFNDACEVRISAEIDLFGFSLT